jgi:hypothetical protein
MERKENFEINKLKNDRKKLENETYQLVDVLSSLNGDLERENKEISELNKILSEKMEKVRLMEEQKRKVEFKIQTSLDECARVESQLAGLEKEVERFANQQRLEQQRIHVPSLPNPANFVRNNRVEIRFEKPEEERKANEDDDDPIKAVERYEEEEKKKAGGKVNVDDDDPVKAVAKFLEEEKKRNEENEKLLADLRSRQADIDMSFAEANEMVKPDKFPATRLETVKNFIRDYFFSNGCLVDLTGKDEEYKSNYNCPYGMCDEGTVEYVILHHKGSETSHHVCLGCFAMQVSKIGVVKCLCNAPLRDDAQFTEMIEILEAIILIESE